MHAILVPMSIFERLIYQIPEIKKVTTSASLLMGMSPTTKIIAPVEFKSSKIDKSPTTKIIALVEF